MEDRVQAAPKMLRMAKDLKRWDLVYSRRTAWRVEAIAPAGDHVKLKFAFDHGEPVGPAMTLRLRVDQFVAVPAV